MKKQAERVDIKQRIDSLILLMNSPVRQKNKCLVI